MSSEDTKLKRSQSRRRNSLARKLFDPGDHKGAFKMKVIPAGKTEYKRKKMNIYNIADTEDVEGNDYDY